jgi:hypothetical protein
VTTYIGKILVLWKKIKPEAFAKMLQFWKTKPGPGEGLAKTLLTKTGPFKTSKTRSKSDDTTDRKEIAEMVMKTIKSFKPSTPEK